jgi:predicted nucleic acid-binding protein
MIPISDDFTVVVDTCVLAHGFLRDVLFNLAEAGVFALRLSDEILEELKRTLKGPGFNWNPGKVDWLFEEIHRVFSSCIVHEYEAIQITGDLPDEKDRHVIQAAVKVKAHQIVTFNKKHFPKAVLDPLEIEVIRPDILLESVFDLYPEMCMGAIQYYLRKNRKPPRDPHEFQEALINYHLMRAAEKTKRWWSNDNLPNSGPHLSWVKLI